jgi:mRNA interferase RelE/StbE
MAKALWQHPDTFKEKLAERLLNPRVPAAILSGMPDCYKIKRKGLGYRLVYRVENKVLFVTVIAVGKRDKSQVYAAAQGRI